MAAMLQTVFSNVFPENLAMLLEIHLNLFFKVDTGSGDSQLSINHYLN